METIAFKVEGMHCAGCAAAIQVLLKHGAGVHGAAVSFEQGEAWVLYDSQTTSEAGLAALIEQGGYRVVGQHQT